MRTAIGSLWVRRDRIVTALATAIVTVSAGLALAQDKGTVNPKPLPPLAHPDDPKTPAKGLFGRRVTAAPVSSVTGAPATASAAAAPGPIAAAAARILLSNE